MEIVIIAILVGAFLFMAALNRLYPLLGIVSGIGMFMLAFSIQTSGLDMVTGFNETINTTLDMTTRVTNFAPITDVFSGLAFLPDLLTLVLGGVGLLILIQSVLKFKWFEDDDDQ